MKITVIGETGTKELEIVTVIENEQCKEYYEALERGDAVGAHLLHIPPYHKPWWMIEWEIKMFQRKAEFDLEQERIKNMSPEMLRVEMELKYGKEKRKKFLGIF